MRVDVWWTVGTEIAGPADTRIHYRAAQWQAGLPARWRGGERGRFLESVMRSQRVREGRLPTHAAARGWRLNAGSDRYLSLSDTGTHFVAAVGDGVPVGVDCELHKPVDDMIGTLRRLRLRRTPCTIEALAPPARLRAFLRLWTAFEAYLKLERLAWDVGAERFAALENHWQIGSEGEARFRRSGVGVCFDHAEVAKSLVLCVATPVAIPLRVHRMVLVTA